MRVTHKVVLTDDGYRVGVTEVHHPHGPRAGLPLVFLHGLGVSSWAYKELLVELSEYGFWVIGLDAMNHGTSGSLPWGHTVEDMMHITAKALDRLRVHSAIMVGHSMGGGMTVEFAARYPHRVLAAVLLDAAAGAEHHAGTRVGKLHTIAPRAVQKLVGAAVDIVGDGVQAIKIRGFRENLRFAKMLRSSLSGFRFVKAAYALMQADTVPLLLELDRRKVPTAILHGERDQIVPLAAARSAAKLAGASLYVLDGAFHSWMLADPEMGADHIAQAVITLLNRSDWE